MRTEAAPIETITREQFERFEAVRQAGPYNMFDPRVCEVGNLSPDVHLGIIKHYSQLLTQWPAAYDIAVAIAKIEGKE